MSIPNPSDGSNLCSGGACCGVGRLHSVDDVGFCPAPCTQQHTEFAVLPRSLGVFMERAGSNHSLDVGRGLVLQHEPKSLTDLLLRTSTLTATSTVDTTRQRKRQARERKPREISHNIRFRVVLRMLQESALKQHLVRNISRITC